MAKKKTNFKPCSIKVKNDRLLLEHWEQTACAEYYANNGNVTKERQKHLSTMVNRYRLSIAKYESDPCPCTCIEECKYRSPKASKRTKGKYNKLDDMPAPVYLPYTNEPRCPIKVLATSSGKCDFKRSRKNFKPRAVEVKHPYAHKIVNF